MKSEEAADIPLLHRKLLTLAEAREKAGILRAAAKAGLDPVVERDRERRSIPTFRKAAREAHSALKEGWKEKGAQTFINSLENHVFEKLGEVRVDKITAADIAAALAPIWTTKPDMARKVRQRIGTVLNFSHGKGWRPLEAPGRSVTVGLPRQPKGTNFKTMPYTDVPAFVASLKSQPETADSDDGYQPFQHDGDQHSTMIAIRGDHRVVMGLGVTGQGGGQA